MPAGFERNLVREGSQQLGIYVDAINGTKAFIGGNYLNSVIRDFNAGLRLNVPDAGQAGLPPAAAAAKIQVTYSNWFNPLGEYKYYIVPGILVILLTMVGGFMSSLNIVREKEAGTIEQINVTPIKKWEFILGKLIPFWIIGMIVFTIGLLVCRGCMASSRKAAWPCCTFLRPFTWLPSWASAFWSLLTATARYRPCSSPSFS
nr:ABC transporter permease [Anseongella ginsenosidimutans]